MAETLAMRMGNRLGVLNAVRMWNPFPKPASRKGFYGVDGATFIFMSTEKNGIIQRKSNKSE
jgi:hypothetical protein